MHSKITPKTPDKALEERIYRIMGAEVIKGYDKAERIVSNYEHHGYDMTTIRAHMKEYLHILINEWYTSNLKRRP